MQYLPFPGRLSRRVLLALALAAATPGLAQYPGGAIVQPLPGADDPAEKLAAALRTLAVSPRDLGALIEAGRDALTLGDPNAAVGFFGRASEVSPRDGRVKAGLGAALVQLEKPRDALRYFQEAGALGVPDADLAEDRGLAYDLIGDPARAQRDYQAVLAARPDDDAVRRKLALSQGISGNRAGAIATLDPLIRKRDIAAWRAQTFVLAMTGDTKGANDITRVMLPQQQAMLQPFLERLATLSPGDKARAVHFGEMPAAGRIYSNTQLATIGTTPTYAPAPVRPVPAAALQIRPAAPTTVPVRVASVPSSIVSTPAPAPTAPLTPTNPAEPSFAAPTVAVSSAPVAQSTISVATRAVAASAPSATTIAAALTAAPGTTATPVIAPAPAPVVTASAPVATVASTAGEVAMPLGASGAAGHFDVPHEIAQRQPVPRVEQPSARPPVAVARNSTAAPAVAAAPGPASANPTVAIARHARSGDVQVASADRPVRVARTRSAVAPVVDPGDTAPSTDDGAKPSVRTTHGGKAAAKPADQEGAATDRKAKRSDHVRVATHEDDTDKAPAKTDEDTPAGRKGRHGERDHVAARDEDDASAGKAHGRDRATDHGRHDDTQSAKVDKSDRSGKADRTEKGSGTAKVYVQVAGGANREDMDKAWAGVKAKAPELMKGRTPSTTPLKATNRLLVGPFKDDAAAQAFVNKMAGRGLSGFTFKSSKGQKVDRVDSGR